MKFFSIVFFSLSIGLTQNLFFSEYAEGSSNNKYLEIYNPTDEFIDLANFAFPNATNGSDGQYEYWNTFDESATIAPGDVYVICHGSSDALILEECDQFHTYLSNGDDGFCLAQGTENSFSCLDWIGDWNDDPGSAWDVCDLGDTKDNTLVRNSNVTSGSEWDVSSNSATCEWIVYPNETWNYLGSHPHDGDTPVVEDCNNGVDDDGDGYIDCDDLDCSNNSDCGGSDDGSCAVYGCVGYTPENSCQCNSLCVDFDNCCIDYEAVCGDVEPSTEDCTNGIDDDGDGFVDCDDWNCDGTIGDADPACEGSGSGEDCGNGLDDDGDGYIDCNDFDCDDDLSCIETDCSDNLDNDQDGYVDCDDFDCEGNPECFSCDQESVDLFFSEYSEGSSNNKYLEIYNPSNLTIDLSCYAYPNATNGGDNGNYDYWNAFDNGAIIEPGDVYVICHGSSDPFIMNECDETHTYLSNGDDGFALVYGSQNAFTALDWIGDWNDDPGSAWEACGVSDATKDHTLVRKTGISSGSEWSVSSSEESCEWDIFDQDTWSNLGFHIVDPNANINPISNAGEDQVVDAGVLVTIDGSNSSDIDGSIIAYVWTQIAGPTVSLSSYDQPEVSFTAPSEGTLEFQLEVYDNEGSSSSDVVSILILGGGMSVSAIQETSDPGSGNDCYPSPYNGQVVTITGIVTAIQPGSNPNFYFEDPDADTFAGVYVYDNSIDPQVGDELLLIAEVEEYYGLTEITNSISSVLISTDNVVEPTLISTSDLLGGCSYNAEQYEGMLVKVENLLVTSTPNEYGEWTVSDGSGDCMIDDYFYDGSIDSYSEGSTITSIVGVVNYAYGEYRILPRNESDINTGSDSCNANGDVNLDGSLDVLDVVFVVGAVLGNEQLNDNQFCISDVNLDGNLDVLDVVTIVSEILNLTLQSSEPFQYEKEFKSSLKLRTNK